MLITVRLAFSDLARSLLQHKTQLVGTLIANMKDIPKDVLKAKLKKGAIKSREDPNGVVVLKKKHQRDVKMLTTKHAPVMVNVSEARGRSQNATCSRSSNSASQDIPLICHGPKSAIY